MTRLPLRISWPSLSIRCLAACLALAVLIPAAPGASAQRFGRNKIQYDNFDWRVLSTPHFEIFFYPEEETLAARAAVIAEDAYVRLSELFEHEFSSQIPFVLYASPNDFQQTNISDGLIGEGTGGFSEPLRNRMVLPYPGDNEGFVHVINHELVHVFMFDIAWGSTKHERGTAAAGSRCRCGSPRACRGMVLRRNGSTNADMWLRDATIYDWVIAARTRSTADTRCTRRASRAMRYIAETYGDEKVVEFFKSVGRTHNVERSMEQTFGTDTATFSEAWEKWLKSEYWPLYSEKQEARAGR